MLIINRANMLAILALALTPLFAQGTDWFVRAGATGGDGSKEKPFKDPYLAMEQVGPGDVIHVAQGIYHGKLNSANWTIDAPNLTWLGGYNDDFTKRDPWQFPSQLRFSKDFKGENDATLIQGGDSHANNFVLDGFVVDAADQNEYADAQDHSLTGSKASKGALITLWDPGFQIRNCVLLNGAEGGIELHAGGCRIENNIIVNIANNPAIVFESHGEGSVIRGNTILFSWCNEGFGSSGTRSGNGIMVEGSEGDYELTDNIFMGCDNAGIEPGELGRMSLKGNVFWLNVVNTKFYLNASQVSIKDANMDELGDAGMKVCQGNVAQNPELAGLDPKWMASFLDRAAENYPSARLEDINPLRQSLGLPTLTEKPAQSQTPYAMPYDAMQAIKILPAKLKQGAHPIPLQVPEFKSAATVVYQYQRIKWQDLVDNAQALDGKRVEIPGAFGHESSVSGFAGISDEDYRGFDFYDVHEQLGSTPIVCIRKGTKPERALKGLIAWDGNGKPPEKHLIRGLVKYDSSANKATVLVDSLSTVEEVAAVENKPRPAGRDWFVRAGSTGDGSKAQPFKDPWQALEAAKPGDSIHVAEGDYFGKFKSGRWKVATPYLSLLGGYDKDFTERDPWRHPTRLGFQTGGAGGDNSYLIGEDDHTGFILDGFVFDGSDISRFDENGNLVANGPGDELVQFRSPDVVVRNCVFVNSAGSAILAWGNHSLIENNIIMNCNWYAIDITTTPEQPFVIRNNTILFTWCAERSNSGGDAIRSMFGTPFELENNIIGFCDGVAVPAPGPLKHLKIGGNIFTHNHVANFTDGAQAVIDDHNLDLFGELGFAAATGNVVVDPKMAFDEKWWAEYSRAERASFYERKYDWKNALHLLPQNPECKAGAKPVKLEVHFNP